MTYSDTFKKIADGLVQYPKRLKVTQEAITGKSISVFVECDPSDYGQIVGRGGRHIQGFQLVFAIAARKRGQSCHISVKKPLEEMTSPKPNPFLDSSWDRNDQLEEHAKTLLEMALDVPYKINCFDRHDRTFLVVTTQKNIPEPIAQGIASIIQAWASLNGRQSKMEFDIGQV